MTLPAGKLTALLLAVGCLAACGDSGNYRTYHGDVGTNDVQGTWTAGCGGTIELKPGGGASLTNVPSYNEQEKFTDANVLYSGDARWTISEGSGWKSDTNPPTLDLVIRNFSSPLQFATVKGKLSLALDIGPLDKDTYCKYSRSA
ncbi:hypothetical protein Caci_4644 [Catenulispora acidiphila DSM 44928]|uniref:Lipoprotein n=1 Tax=Catenulispora acidiphila (strain DSM 44928 / JCM 14897 / NBRC 102108 / NRRL B-24433 / ID139908) TaxID=479433 RepID=C7PY45_CATAD|nr:hypothetical protein [Catenulispora acidiphila]ACU73505.1 hypothetical protein Caci_4644 [Catenulispora acidiphila DSM 44928]